MMKNCFCGIMYHDLSHVLYILYKKGQAKKIGATTTPCQRKVNSFFRHYLYGKKYTALNLFLLSINYICLGEVQGKILWFIEII
jgi:hypothetical protein